MYQVHARKWQIQMGGVIIKKIVGRRIITFSGNGIIPTIARAGRRRRSESRVAQTSKPTRVVSDLRPLSSVFSQMKIPYIVLPTINEIKDSIMRLTSQSLKIRLIWETAADLDMLPALQKVSTSSRRIAPKKLQVQCLRKTRSVSTSAASTSSIREIQRLAKSKRSSGFNQK